MGRDTVILGTFGLRLFAENFMADPGKFFAGVLIIRESLAIARFRELGRLASSPPDEPANQTTEDETHHPRCRERDGPLAQEMQQGW